MSLYVFENLFKSERKSLEESKDCRFFTVTSENQLRSESFFNFLNDQKVKVLFFYSRSLNRQKALETLLEFSEFRLYQSSLVEKSQIYFLPKACLQIMKNLKSLKQFSFFNNRVAKVYFYEGKLRQNKDIKGFLKVFCFWLVCVVVAFFWEKSEFESNYT
jgi:hypothetical protein